jgi:hypothetical protein
METLPNSGWRFHRRGMLRCAARNQHLARLAAAVIGNVAKYCPDIIIFL